MSADAMMEKENLEAVENFKGSRDEKLVVLYCKQLGINYKNLSDEEFRWLIRILKKSKKMGTPISQRKKRIYFCMPAFGTISSSIVSTRKRMT